MLNGRLEVWQVALHGTGYNLACSHVSPFMKQHQQMLIKRGWAQWSRGNAENEDFNCSLAFQWPSGHSKGNVTWWDIIQHIALWTQETTSTYVSAKGLSWGRGEHKTKLRFRLFLVFLWSTGHSSRNVTGWHMDKHIVLWPLSWNNPSLCWYKRAGQDFKSVIWIGAQKRRFKLFTCPALVKLCYQNRSSLPGQILLWKATAMTKTCQKYSDWGKNKNKPVLWNTLWKIQQVLSQTLLMIGNLKLYTKRKLYCKVLK